MERTSGGKPTALDRLAADVRRLSDLLTRERGCLADDYLRDAGLRSAYRAYFLPANIPKVHLPLTELLLPPIRLLAYDRLRVLDIGTGPGTAVLGVLSFFAERKVQPRIEFTAVDKVAENLRETEAVFPEHVLRYAGTASLRTVQCGAGEAASRLPGPFDLIVLSNVLNELFVGEPERLEKRVRVVAGILHELLDDAGSGIVIEPALRETSRDLLQVRDGLVRLGFTIYSPCLVQKPCPALAEPKDWCHEDRPWTPPEIVQQIDSRAGLRKDSLKFSYLVLRKDRRTLADHTGEDAMRVVSEPLVSKGKREYYVCGRRGRRLVVRLDKEASRQNAAFTELVRGDVVRFEGLLDERSRFRVTKETTVDVIPVVIKGCS